MKILAISATFPSVADPSRGVFVKERLAALARLPDVQLRVLSPTPWFPPVRRFEKWYRWSQYPMQETFEGLLVDNPRYLLPPKVGGYVHPQLMRLAIVRKVDRLREEFRFDVLDAHYIYPAGSLAVMLGKRYGVPVVMTGRGEDMERFPALPLIGKTIRWTLGQAQQSVAVSQQIAAAMRTHGADPRRVHVIPNGIDTEKFHLKSQAACRRHLKLSADRRIILSVGDRLELKGFHLLVEALPAVLRQVPDALYVIVGGKGRFGRDYTAAIQDRIESLGLEQYVRLVGPRPHGELVDWYNAADVYAMMSSREGSPNVLLEALASGTPAVGTAVGGIRDELSRPERGLLLEHRTPQAAAEALVQALQHPWDRPQIRASMLDRSWDATARHVHQVLQRALDHHSQIA